MASITTDADSIIDYINPVAETLTGWRLEDAMGRNVDEVFRAFHEETCEPLENPLTGSIRRVRPIKSVAAGADDPPRRQRAVRGEHGRSDPRRPRHVSAAPCWCSMTSARAAS